MISGIVIELGSYLISFTRIGFKEVKYVRTRRIVRKMKIVFFNISILLLMYLSNLYIHVDPLPSVFCFFMEFPSMSAARMRDKRPKAHIPIRALGLVYKYFNI
jgi:hypothetical protein